MEKKKLYVLTFINKENKFEIDELNVEEGKYSCFSTQKTYDGFYIINDKNERDVFLRNFEIDKIIITRDFDIRLISFDISNKHFKEVFDKEMIDFVESPFYKSIYGKEYINKLNKLKEIKERIYKIINFV